MVYFLLFVAVVVIVIVVKAASSRPSQLSDRDSPGAESGGVDWGYRKKTVSLDVQEGPLPLGEAKRAATDCYAIWIEYLGGDGASSERTINTYEADQTYAYAWCQARNEPRVFRLDRVVGWAPVRRASFDRSPLVARYVTEEMRRKGSSRMAFNEWKSQQKSGSGGSRAASGQEVVQQNLDWLKARWARAASEKADKNLETVDKWFFHKVTKAQLNRLQRLDVNWPAEDLTKGKASDLIGLFEKIEPEASAVLRFFKLPVKGLSQSKAREEAAILLADEENRAKWDNRTPSAEQKAFFKLIARKSLKGVGHKRAEDLMEEVLAALSDTNDPRYDEWEAFETIVEELDDPDIRADYGMKKVNVGVIADAVAALMTDGLTIRQIGDDLDRFVAKVLDMKPNLRRASH